MTGPIHARSHRKASGEFCKSQQAGCLVVRAGLARRRARAMIPTKTALQNDVLASEAIVRCVSGDS